MNGFLKRFAKEKQFGDSEKFLRLFQKLFGPQGWESLALLQGSFGPFGPKVANRVRKWVPRPSRRWGPKSPQRSRKRVKIDNFSTILTLFDSVLDFLGPRVGRAREPIFELYLRLSARKAQMTPVAGKSFRVAGESLQESLRIPGRNQRFFSKKSHQHEASQRKRLTSGKEEFMLRPFSTSKHREFLT